MKKQSQFVPMAEVTGLNDQGRETLGWNNRSLPPKQPSQFNINIANRSQAGNFNYDNLIKPTTRQFLTWRRPSSEQTAYQNRLQYRPYRQGGGYSSSQQPNTQLNTHQLQPTQAPQHYTVGQYIQQFPPTPAGAPYRHVNFRPSYGTVYDTLADYTTLLNRLNIYPEEVSELGDPAYYYLDDDKGPRHKSQIYHVDGRDAANWLWNRRGLQLTDEQWDRAVRARYSPNSQINAMPQSTYFAWSKDNDKVNAYSLRLSDEDRQNQFIHVFNPSYFDNTYRQSDYSGYGLEQNDGRLLEPWERLMGFQDVQDHELSHSFNDPYKPDKWTWNWDDWSDHGFRDENDQFFRITNNPDQPYYDSDTTRQRRNKYFNMFRNTYLEEPGEYLGAMGRLKRYGAELGFDTTSPDPVKARSAMAHTLHYFATHQKPEELTPEQQRLHSWLNTAAGDHMLEYSQDYIDNINELRNMPVNSEEELRQRALRRQQLEQNFNTDRDNYIKDAQSPFYRDVLQFMTDDTIQGLVRNVPNNTSALNNLRSAYA